MLGVSVSGYYDWRDRAPGATALANAVLVERIRRLHGDLHHSYPAALDVTARPIACFDAHRREAVDVNRLETHTRGLRQCHRRM